ncbi:MAG: YkgJ family cysteine cluster protein [Desulfobacterales bacterium]|nr:YkgJ family cysteine cluster protein [Desulfobacterales bacterium]
MSLAMDHCRRCGTCCRKGGPALHRQDLEIVRSGRLEYRHLLTIRKGEWAYSPLTGQVEPTTHELVKTANQANEWACSFYDEPNRGCTIYDHRPLECRLLKCWAPEELVAVIGRHTLARTDIISPDNPLLGLVLYHERECPATSLARLVPENSRQAADQDKLAELTALVRKDLAIRRKAIQYLGPAGNEELFFLGRPLFIVLRAHGLVVHEQDGVLQLGWRPAGHNETVKDIAPA